MSMFDEETMLEEAWLQKREKGPKEQVFTSTGSKLLSHPERLKSFRDDDKPMPIVMHIMPTDICNFQCTFCSVGNRSGYEKAKLKPGAKPDVLQLSQIKHVVDYLTSIGLKAVILSGGGEPTIYRDDDGNDFGDLIAYLKSKGLEIGLITNGSMLNKWEKEVSQLTWVRVSLYPPQYNLDVVHLPENIPESTTLGFSWVMSYPQDEDPSTISEEQIVDKYQEFAQSVKEFAKINAGRYIRLLPDCHTYGENFIKNKNNYFLIEKSLNSGRSQSLLLGIKRASGDIILPQDADLEYDPNDYEKLISPIMENKCDVVFGSRMIGEDGYSVDALYSTFGLKFLNWVQNFLYGTNYTDSCTCYIAMRKNIWKSFDLSKTKNFTLNATITSNLAKRKISVKEIGIRYHPRKWSEGKKVNILRDGSEHIFTLVKEKFKPINKI